MRSVRFIVPALTVLLFASACGGDDATDPIVDTDVDGILDADDPTPNGSTDNHLNGTFTGGAASVVEIMWYDSDGTVDVDEVYDDDLTQACSTTWYPQGTLCDEAPTTHDPDTSTKTSEHSGATWYADGLAAQSGTGVLVVDACSTSACDVVDYNEARVFQMFSDGKATHIRIFVHPDVGDTPPAWDDTDWDALTGLELIEAGVDVDADGLTVTEPTVLSLTPGVARYFRFDVQNDGRYGDESYIELRSVKLFSVPLA